MNLFNKISLFAFNYCLIFFTITTYNINLLTYAQTSNICSLPQATQSTLGQYAAARKINVGGMINNCLIDSNSDQNVCKKTAVKEYAGMIVQYQDTWRTTEKTKGINDFTNFDKAIDFAKKSGFKLHFFHLIWTNSGQNKYVPTWLFTRTPEPLPTGKTKLDYCGSWTKEELLAIMKEHIQTTIQHAGNTVSYWNVVNEAFNNETGEIINDCFKKIIGAPEYIDKAFIYAREASPKGILVLNDAFGRDRMIKAGVDGFFDYVKKAKERDIPIDAVGLQNHLLAKSGDQFSSGYLKDLEYFFQKAKNANIKVIISEMDVYQAGHSQQEVANLYQNVMAMCLTYNNCISLETWGISDKYSWARLPQNANLSDAQPLLFNDSYQRKPAYYGVMSTIRENTTRPCISPPVPKIKEIIYSTIDNIELKLDICSPPNPSLKLPTVIFIHGGGFSSGDKSSGTDKFCELFTKNNYIFVSVNYRLSSQAKYPAGFDDVQYAVRWLRKNSDIYHIDSKRIASMGSSAGATFASLLGVRDTRDSNRGLNNYSSKVNAVISNYGIQDFINGPFGTWDPRPTYLLNDLQKIKDISTVTHLTPDDAPFLLVHGIGDSTVLPAQSTNFSNKLNSNNISNKIFLYHGGHGGSGISPQENTNLENEMLNFLKKYLTTNPSPTPTPPPSSCNECPQPFACYQNGDEFKWFAKGMPMIDFTEVADSECSQITKPTFKGKANGDANCDGYITVVDYSLWHKEFFDGNKGAIVKSNWNADFTGSDGKCDGKVDIYDFSLWHTKFISTK